MELIEHYFPDLSSDQLGQFAALAPIYKDWNSKINVISRKDMDQFYERHVLHSLAIQLLAAPKPNQKVLDMGTGGGFPGIPLAMLNPETHFSLVDSIAKKIKVVNEVKTELKLNNVQAYQERVENIKEKFDLIMSRAVAPASKMIGWTKNSLSLRGKYLFLKGGDLKDEIHELKAAYPRAEVEIYPLGDVFSEPFFESKQLLQIGFK